MLRLKILAVALVVDIALLIDTGLTAAAEMPGCNQASNLPTARVRWAAVRKNHVDPTHNEEHCRSYATNFLEAVTARQDASFCKESSDRERILEFLDFEIEAFNDLIATLCSR
jgi:hypothetical protein